jgi:hypothetical protein
LDALVSALAGVSLASHSSSSSSSAAASMTHGEQHSLKKQSEVSSPLLVTAGALPSSENNDDDGFEKPNQINNVLSSPSPTKPSLRQKKKKRSSKGRRSGSGALLLNHLSNGTNNNNNNNNNNSNNNFSSVRKTVKHPGGFEAPPLSEFRLSIIVTLAQLLENDPTLLEEIPAETWRVLPSLFFAYPQSDLFHNQVIFVWCYLFLLTFDFVTNHSSQHSLSIKQIILKKKKLSLL